VSCLKELVWEDATKVEGVYCTKTDCYIKDAVSFCSTLITDYVVRKDEVSGKFIVNYGGRTVNSYDTLEEAQDWAEYTHYKGGMSPVIKKEYL
jgi:hypothetical protein